MGITEDQIIEIFDASGKLIPDATAVGKRLMTVSCDAEGCDKTISFDPASMQQVLAANPWTQNVRTILTSDNRKQTYCCDDCEVKGVTTGNHNIPVKKVIDIATGTNAMKDAAAQAKAQQAAETAIRTGGPR